MAANVRAYRYRPGFDETEEVGVLGTARNEIQAEDLVAEAGYTIEYQDSLPHIVIVDAGDEGKEIHAWVR